MEEMHIMFREMQNRMKRSGISLLCFIIVCFLLGCTVNECPEFTQLSAGGSKNVSSLVSPENEFNELVSGEITGQSVIKSVVSKNPAAGRETLSGEPLLCAVIGDLFLFTGTCVRFPLYFYKDLATSHHFIITYIHNLDGRKP